MTLAGAVIVAGRFRSRDSLDRFDGALSERLGQLVQLVFVGIAVGILVVPSVAMLEGAGHGSLLIQLADEPA